MKRDLILQLKFLKYCDLNLATLNNENGNVKFNNNSKTDAPSDESTPAQNSSSSQTIFAPSVLEDSSSSLSIQAQVDTTPVHDIPSDVSSSDILNNAIDQSVQMPSIGEHRERTMSDTSSDTVDYEFDTETSMTLRFEF